SVAVGQLVCAARKEGGIVAVYRCHERALAAPRQVKGMLGVAVGHQRGHRAEDLELVRQRVGVGLRGAQKPGRHACGHLRIGVDQPDCTSSCCRLLTNEPMRTSGWRGSPTVTAASSAAMACAARSYASCGTRMRRMAVHFWPDLMVLSRTTSRTIASKAGPPEAASG